MITRLRQFADGRWGFDEYISTGKRRQIRRMHQWEAEDAWKALYRQLPDCNRRKRIYKNPSDGQDGFVYVIGRTGCYKIGKAINVQARLKQLQSGSSFGLRILREWSTDDAYKLEKSIHRVLASKRRHGEWFSVSLKDIDAAFSEISSSLKKGCTQLDLSLNIPSN